MSDVYIVAGQRSPIAKYLGALSSVSLVDLATQTLTQTLTNAQISPQIIDHFILGNVLGYGAKQGPARQIAVNSAIPIETPAYSLNMICGSGLKAVVAGYAQIQAGLDNCVAVVGAESMSSVPFLLGKNIRLGHRMGDFKTIDPIVNDGLTDAFSCSHMGITAENIVRKCNFNRQELDQFALASHQKATAAIKSGDFKAEIVPITIKNRKGDVIFDQDEGPRDGLTIEQLAKLAPAFEKDGIVTAGNSSSLNDGAAALVLANQATIDAHKLTKLVKIIAVGQSGIDPQIMGLGPIVSVVKALDKANLNINDIDIFEFNEAFAAQSLGVIQGLAEHYQVTTQSISDKSNLKGGAISLGHPIGCSGARILVTLIHSLKQHNKKYGLATLCIGGGMGIAIVVENCQ